MKRKPGGPRKPRLEIVVDPKSKGLTERQEKFCLIYATEEVTRSEAALRAGYSKQTAKVVGSLLLNGRDYPKVVARIAELKAELGRKYEVTFENHVRQLARIREAAMEHGNFPAAVSAEKARGQAAGLYVTRQEILVGKIDQMSRDEVMAEIARLQQEFPALSQSTAPTLDLSKIEGSETYGVDPEVLRELEE